MGNKGVTSGIYRIYDRDTHISYIGKSKDIRRRWQEHARKFNSKQPQREDLYRLIFDPVFEILYEVDDHTQLNYWEQSYITEYDSFVNGANMTLGGKTDLIKSCVHVLRTRKLNPQEVSRIEGLLRYARGVR